jgi:hypothetical protein
LFIGEAWWFKILNFGNVSGLSYIENSWGKNFARKFVEGANQLLLNLSEHPHLCKSPDR